MKNEIKAILFDSGRVLNKPASGHWFISPNFFQYVDRKAFYAINKRKRDAAFRLASQYINEQNLIETEEEEYREFLEYYKILFRSLPELPMTDERIESVTKDLVYNCGKYVFYPDAMELIPQLSREYRLAVVSDAWPSMEHVYRKAGMRDYFSSFVVSSIVGVTKPDERMYRKALTELGVSPGEALFIDDSRKNCDGAKKLGIQTLLICRDYRLFLYRKFFRSGHRIIRNLKGLTKYL